MYNQQGSDSDSSSNSDESDDDSSCRVRRIKCHKWKRAPNLVGKGEHMVKLASFGTLTDLYKELVEGLPNVKRVQTEANKASRANVGGEKGLLQVDFAENYHCVWQGEIQSAHWGKVIFVVCFQTDRNISRIIFF